MPRPARAPETAPAPAPPIRWPASPAPHLPIPPCRRSAVRRSAWPAPAWRHRRSRRPAPPPSGSRRNERPASPLAVQRAPPVRRAARSPGAAHGNGADHRARPEAPRRAWSARAARLVVAAAGFAVLFGALAIKLADATIIEPMLPNLPPRTSSCPRRRRPGQPTRTAEPLTARQARHDHRPQRRDPGDLAADRGLYANPREMIDPAEAAHKLKSVLPELDEATRGRTAVRASKQFVYLARQITPREQLRDQRAGHSGHLLRVRPSAAAIRSAASPPRCSAASTWTATASPGWNASSTSAWRTIRAAAAVARRAGAGGGARGAVARRWTEFSAIGACGIVMDVRTGEVLAMVSLPDYDANHVRPDRAGRPLQPLPSPACTSRAARSSCRPRRWRSTTASSICGTASTPARPIHIGRFTINDFEGKHRFLYVPGNPRLLVQHRRRADRRRRPARAAAGLDGKDGHVEAAARRTARGRRADWRRRRSTGRRSRP